MASRTTATARDAPAAPERPLTAVFLWHELGEAGGVERILLQLRHGLPAHGVEAHIIELAPAQAPGSREAAGDPRVLRLPPRGWETLRAYYDRLFEHLRGLQPDVLVISEGVALGFVPCLPEDLPLVACCHSHVRHERHWILADAHRFRRVAAVSPGLRDHLVRLLGDRPPVELVLPGVEPPTEIAARSGGPGQPLKIIYVGRLVQKDKRVRDLVPFVTELDALGVDYRLTIAGDGEEAAHLREALAAPVGAGRVKLVGSQPHETLMPLLARHDLAVLFSESEGFSLVMLEAATRSLALVVTRMQGAGLDFFQDGASVWTFPVGAPLEAARICRRLAVQPGALREAGDAARGVAEQFRLSRMVEGYAGVLRKAAGAFDGARFWPHASIPRRQRRTLQSHVKSNLPQALVPFLSRAGRR